MAERILFILPSLTGLRGGIELYDRQLVEAVAKARPDAELAAVLAAEAPLADPLLLDESVRARLRVAGAAGGGRGRRVLRFLEAAGRTALAFRPTLVVCGHVNHAVLARAIAAASGARLVVLVYGIEAWSIRGGSGVGRGGVGAALVAADVVVSISAFTAAQLLRNLPIDPARFFVLPNAVDLERYRPGPPSPAVSARLSHLAHPRLLTVCRLDARERYKGVDVLIRAVSRLHAHRPLSLVVAGDGTDLPRLRDLAAVERAPIEFYGFAPEADLPDLYRAADLFVMPSRNEGFGYVFIEALASGVPVIAGGVDGSVDALAGGRLGLLVNPLDASEVAEAITAFLDGTVPAALRDPETLRAAVSARFSLAAFAGRVEQLLSRLAA